MKKNITRIYDKNKVDSRKKYMLIILLILVLQVAIYFGAFSKAETVIPIEYINYYSLETYDSSIEVKSDISGRYVVLPGAINNRQVITYFIEEVVKTTVSNTIDGETVNKTTETKTYNPNDKYYIGSSETLSIKAEYGEYIVAQTSEESETIENTNTIAGNTINIQDNTLTVNNTIQTPDSSDASSDNETTIRDTIYIGERGQEGQLGTIEQPYRTIAEALKALPETGGTIKIVNTAVISSWGDNDQSILEGQSIKIASAEGFPNSVIKMTEDWNLKGNTTISDVKLLLAKDNLSIYANGYNLVLGEYGKKDSLKIGDDTNTFYPNVYGGSKTKELNNSTNLVINAGKYNYIYGGSNDKKINGNTNLTINYIATAKGAIYGGSAGNTITGSTIVNIGEATCGISIYGGSKRGTINRSTDLTINNVEVEGSIFGGSNQGNVAENSKLKITEKAIVKQDIYGGSNNGGLIGKDTILDIVNAEVGGSIYGGSKVVSVKEGESYNGTISGGTVSNITYAKVSGSIYGGSANNSGSADNGVINIDTTLNITNAIVSGSIFGGSHEGKIKGNTDLNITYAEVGGSIYGGSYEASLTNTDLYIENAKVEGYVYGGSYKGTITGNSISTIDAGTYASSTAITTNQKNDSVISGGSNAGTIKGNVKLEIKNATIGNGSITGAGNGTNLSGTINLDINNVTLSGSGSIYGYAYNGGTTGSKDIDITINKLNGKPEYIIGYTFSGGGATTGTKINMNLSGIDSPNMQVYGGVYDGTQTKGMVSNITTSGVVGKLLSPSGIKASSIKKYNINVTGGSFSEYIYAGRVVNGTAANVVDDNNTLILNNYEGKIAVRNKIASITLNNNSNVTTEDGFFYSNITLNNNSNLEIGKVINNPKNSLGNVYINDTSTLAINNSGNSTKQVVIAGNLSGTGNLKVYDTTNVIVKKEVIVDNVNPLKVGIIEDSNLSNHYINIISQNEGNEDIDELVSIKETVNEEEIDKYKRDFISNISYWKFYTEEDDKIESQENAVYIDSINGDDTNPGTIDEPVKTIEKASEKIGDAYESKKIVIISDLNLNNEPNNVPSNSNIYTITTTDGKMNFLKDVNLADDNGINNIYQNLKFENLGIISGKTSVSQNIYLNGNKLIIGNGVTTNVNTSSKIYVNIYGGTNSKNLQNLNSDIEINSGTWYYVYGGNNVGEVENGQTSVKIQGSTTISGVVFGGSNTGEFKGNTYIEINTTSGSINAICGGNNNALLVGNTEISVKKASKIRLIYGGNNGKNTDGTITGNMQGNTNVVVTTGTIESLYGGSCIGNMEGNTSININGGSITNIIYGGSNRGSITGIINMNIAGGTVAGDIYGGSNRGTITGTVNTNITGGTIKANVYGGSTTTDAIIQRNSESNIGGTNLKINGRTITGYSIYGGSNGGNIEGEVYVELVNNTFGEKTKVYRGSNSGNISGAISSKIQNINFSSNTETILYGGSNTGNITGNLSFTLSDGMFKNDICNAIVYGGSNTGNITGNLDVNISKITFNSNVYGGSNTGTIQGKTNFTTSEITSNADLYGIGNSKAETDNNTVTINNSTIKNAIYAIKNTGSNILGATDVAINSTSFQTLYAFNEYTSMNKEVVIAVNNIERDVTIETVKNKPDTNLNAVLTFSFANNTSNKITVPKNINIKKLEIDNSKNLLTTGKLTLKEFYITNNSEVSTTGELNLEKFYITNNSNVIVGGILNTNNLTITSGGFLDLNKESNVTGILTGADSNYGKIDVLEKLNIGSATGKTILGIGIIEQEKSTLSELSEKDSFININGTTVYKEDKEKATTITRIWKVGNINNLEVVYVDGEKGDDSNDGTEGVPVKTLEQAYRYIKEREENETDYQRYIVICGNTTVKYWPENATKEVIITSKYGGKDYTTLASLSLQADTGNSLTLKANTSFEYLKIDNLKPNNIYANGNSLTLGKKGEDSSIIINRTTDTNTLALFGGDANNSVSSTNLIINAGSYDNIYGGGAGVTGEIDIEINGGNIGNIEYEANKTTTITINDSSKVNMIYAKNATKHTTGQCTININTTNPIDINGKNKENNCIVNFKEIGTSDSIVGYNKSIKNVKQIYIEDSYINYTNTIENIGILDIDTSYVNYTNTIKNIGTLNAVSSQVEIGNNSAALNLGTINIDSNSTIKLLSKSVAINGYLNGEGNLYLDDGVEVEISEKANGSIKVFCNNSEEYFGNGATIKENNADDDNEVNLLTFKKGDTEENWHTEANTKDGVTSRVWQPNEINIKSIIYVSKEGKDDALGTKDMPTNSLEAAYEIANTRYKDEIGNKYYIVLMDEITLSSNILTTENINNIEIVISSNEPTKDEVNFSDENNYISKSKLIINTNGKLDFAGRTTLRNINIKVNDTLEFFANGKEITFGEGIVIEAPAERYPIIYGGADNADITSNTNLIVLSGTYNMIFGGGKSGDVTGNINLTIGATEESSEEPNIKGYEADDDGKTGVFGGGRTGDVQGTIVLNINSGTFNRIYGAGIEGNVNGDININFNGGNTIRLYGAGQGTTYNTELGIVEGNVTVNIGKSSNEAKVTKFLRGSGQYSGITGNTNLNIFGNAILGTDTQVAAGGYQGNVKETYLNIQGGTINCDVYGGGWGDTNDSTKGQSGNTNVHVYTGVTIDGDIYGGGHAGPSNNTKVVIENATVNNVYGGGQGRTATVKGESKVIIAGTTNVKENVFGGGNESRTGTLEMNSGLTNVYILGGKIEKDVYGGANTSEIYGNTFVKIGASAVEDLKDTIENIESLENNIDIKGTVFGGGRANEAGSENYDFNYISVHGNTYVDINGEGYNESNEGKALNIGKSIFASGNAATISGEGNVIISNYNEIGEEPKELLSIQRAENVVIDNSILRIAGTMDRTNDMATIKYTVNRVNNLKLKNNSILYLENSVNLVENLYSLDSNNNQVVVGITEVEDQKIVNLNNESINNKIYLLHGKNMVIGEGGIGTVNGMMFLGKFEIKSDDTINTGMYSDYNQGDIFNGESKFDNEKTSYLQAKHYDLDYSNGNEESSIYGFYTNHINNEKKIEIKIIKPTPPEGTYSQWIIGDISEIIYYSDIELIASKYSSTGQATLELTGLNNPDLKLTVDEMVIEEEDDTTFTLIDEDAIESTSDKANSEFGLTMATGHQGWKANQKTEFFYNENKEATMSGEDYVMYYADKSNTTPILIFNLAHSKNITETKNLGKAIIRLTAEYTDEEGNSKFKKVEIELILTTNNSSSDILYYEGAITPGLKYDVFPNAATNITEKSAVSAYYSVYLDANNESDKKILDEYFNETSNYNSYYHVLTSNYALPQGTKIVMLDKTTDKYYYYIVKGDDYELYDNEYQYKFSNFTAMGTTDIKYSDTTYYKSDENYLLEEFIIQLSFENTEITNNQEGKLNIKLVKNDSESIINVHNDLYPMTYNIYTGQDVSKKIEVTKLTVDAKEEDTKTVILSNSEQAMNLGFTINTEYNYQVVNSNVIYDTTNFDNAEGLRITFETSDGEILSDNILTEKGVNITNGTSGFGDGSIRFKIADMVCNLETAINLVNINKLDPGTYIMKIEAIAAADGISSSKAITSTSVSIILLSTDYGLTIEDLDSNSQIIDNETGTNLNGNNNLDFTVKYQKGLESPNIKISLYRRYYEENVTKADYMLSSEYNEQCDLSEFISKATVNGIERQLNTSTNEYSLIEINRENEADWTGGIMTYNTSLELKNELRRGTYKLKFLIYDGNTYIGEVYKMIIIR